MKKVLKALNIKAVNNGVSTGLESWAGGGKVLSSYSPVDGTLIGKVRQANHEDYEKVIGKAEEAYKIWREIPAPKRGEIVRQMGDALRANKDNLGRLVSYEMGKSLQEGWGEV